MPEFSSGSSFEYPPLDLRKESGEMSVARPTSEAIAEMARKFLEDPYFRSSSRHEGAIRDIRNWSKDDLLNNDSPDQQKVRSEAYPGWTSKDFRELLLLLEEGSRPDEEAMRKRMDGFFRQLQDEGWTKEDFLQAMKLFQGGPES